MRGSGLFRDSGVWGKSSGGTKTLERSLIMLVNFLAFFLVFLFFPFIQTLTIMINPTHYMSTFPNFSPPS